MSDWVKSSLLVLALLCLSLVGCKQGEGEVCQVDEDCEVGLSCNATTGLCQPDSTGPTIDAAPTPDAPEGTPDAATPDAATPDATI